MNKNSILIIEDDATIREMYKVAFELAEIEVFVATNGAEGVEMALLHHPALILIDIMMPVMNGHEAMSRIRNDAWGKDAKVIFLTNTSDPEDIVNAVKQGSEEYIVKANTTVPEVVNIVRTALHT